MGTPVRERAGAASGPGERDLVRRLGAVDMVTGLALAPVVAVAAVLPADPGPAGRAAWVAAVEPGLWLLLGLWSCGAVLRTLAGAGPASVRATAWLLVPPVLLIVAGLTWPAVLAHVLGVPASEAVAGGEAAVTFAVAVGAWAGWLLRGARGGRSLPAYVVGRIVASPVSGPVLTAGRLSLPLYLGSQLGMLILLNRGDPAWGYRIGEWLEPYALGHNRAGLVLVVCGLWALVVVLLPHRRLVAASGRATRE